MKARYIILVSIIIMMAAGCNQTPSEPAADSAKPQFPPQIKSPEVHEDGRITFRFRAPNAQKVILNRDGAERQPMQKDEQGIWSVTTDPLEPDFYPYTFMVDGSTLADPSNPIIKHVLPGGNQTLAHVPGPTSLSWELNEVPHGIVHHHIYKSEAVGDDRDYYVYTPPGYDPAGREQYPVLFLLHGVTDDASAWTTAGRANVILDNLIAQGKAKPMLMVNTLGYGMPDALSDLSKMFSGAGQKESMSNFTRSILEEVMPQVEKIYRASKDRNSRAIAGLSMGGAQTLHIGLNNLDRFAYIAAFSSAIMMLGQDFDKSILNLDAKADSQIRLLWVACGTEDGLIQGNREFKNWLESKNIKFTSIETPGAHTWMVWRRNLTEVAPLLFR